jgi:EAL domain-containing protein (putative c-di-GMP-specific phosphodiesterase class I)
VEIRTAVAEIDGGIHFKAVDPMQVLAQALERAEAGSTDAGAPPPPVTWQEEPRQAPSADVPRWREVERSRPAAPEVVGTIATTGEDLQRLLRAAENGTADWHGSQTPQAKTLYDPAEDPHRRDLCAGATAAAGGDLMRVLRTAEQSFAGWQRFRTPKTVAVYEQARPASAPAAPSLVSQVRFLYEPVWDTTKKAITSYQALLRFQTPTGLVPAAEVPSLSDIPDADWMLDRLLLRRCFSDLAALLAQGKKAIVTAPIHCSTAVDPGKLRQYAALCGELPDDLRFLLVLELVDSYTVPWEGLAPAVATLRKVCRSVLLRISLDQPNFARIAPLGVAAVGGDLRDHPWPEKQAMERLEEFAGGAEAAGLRSYVLGLPTQSLAVAAACAGFDYMAGPAVVPEVPRLRGVSAFDSVNLVIRSLPAKQRPGG